MPLIKLRSKDSADYRIDLPSPTKGFSSAYAFAFAKSGSTLQDNILATYCQSIGVSTVSIYNQAFDQGVKTQDIGEEAKRCFVDQGYVYLGFRHFPEFDLELKGIKTVLLARDPRDMLVSLYYSITRSHVIPKGNTAFKSHREQLSRTKIDDYVLNTAATYNIQLIRYLDGLSDSDLTIYRYEDVIYNKLLWMEKVISHLGLKVDYKKLQRSVKKFDVRPDKESPDKHIRQVHPGDHRNKLRPETIRKLNEKLQPFLEHFEYSIDGV